MNRVVRDRLAELGVVTYTEARNYGREYSHSISSYHFYTSVEPDADGCMDEVAMFQPDMVIDGCGDLSGFTEIRRRNCADVLAHGFRKWRHY